MMENTDTPTVAGYSAQDLVNLFEQQELAPIINVYERTVDGVEYGCILTAIRRAGLADMFTSDQLTGLEIGWEEKTFVWNTGDPDIDAIRVGQQAAEIAKPHGYGFGSGELLPWGEYDDWR